MKRVMGRASPVRPRPSRNVRLYARPLACLLATGALLGLLAFSCVESRAAPDPKPGEGAGKEAAPKAKEPAPKADGAAAANAAETGAGKTGTAKTATAKSETADGIWSANRNDSKITLRGAVPSEEDRQTALGMVKARFPDLTIEDKVEVAPTDQPREQWLAAVSFGLQQLTHMSRGKVRLDAGVLTVVGQASGAEEYGRIKKALAGPSPAGLTLKDTGVRPPVADPFVFQADLGPNALSLAGSVPSEGARKSVRDLSRQLFERPGLDDRLEVASGAPKNWDKAVAAALRALSRLETGTVALSGVAVSIEGVAPDQGTAVAVSSQLRRDLPERFSTSESIKWKEAASHLPLETEPGSAQDMAATIVPRIKLPARDGARWQSGALPPLLPLNTGH